MELPTFLVTCVPQPEPSPRSDKTDLAIGKQYPVNSTHFSPNKNYTRHTVFAKGSSTPMGNLQDPLERAKELFLDINYSFGRIRHRKPLFANANFAKLAPGPCNQVIKRELPPLPDTSEVDKVTFHLEKGFSKVTTKPGISPLKRDKAAASKSTSPRMIRKTAVPMLSTTDRERLKTAFRSRLRTIRTTLERRVSNTVHRHQKHHIFSEEVNDIRTQTSLSSAVEYQ